MVGLYFGKPLMPDELASFENPFLTVMSCVCLCVGEYMLPASSPVGLHKLVQSLCGLQGERSQLRGELRSLHSQLEQRERDRHTKVQAFQQQVIDSTFNPQHVFMQSVMLSHSGYLIAYLHLFLFLPHQ